MGRRSGSVIRIFRLVGRALLWTQKGYPSHCSEDSWSLNTPRTFYYFSTIRACTGVYFMVKIGYNKGMEEGDTGDEEKAIEALELSPDEEDSEELWACSE